MPRATQKKLISRGSSRTSLSAICMHKVVAFSNISISSKNLSPRRNSIHDLRKYKSEGEVSQKRSSSLNLVEQLEHKNVEETKLEAKPAGFLSFVESQVDLSKLDQKKKEVVTVNPRDRLLFEYQLLVFQFPTFPKSMLKTMLIREQGRSLIVAKELVERGWGGTSNDFSDLSAEPNHHFTLNYFWGSMQPEFKDILQKKGDIGTYFTALVEPNKYVICYIDSSGELKERNIRHPEMQLLHKKIFKIDKHLARPEEIALQNLITFLL